MCWVLHAQFGGYNVQYSDSGTAQEQWNKAGINADFVMTPLVVLLYHMRQIHLNFLRFKQKCTLQYTLVALVDYLSCLKFAANGVHV